jgi:hypothetical protein
MRFVLVAGFVFVGMSANAFSPCDSDGPLGLTFVPFPASVPSPGGHAASGVYVDNRGGCNTDIGCHIPLGLGSVLTGSDWVYLETNGEPGLQRGGCSSLPDTPLTGSHDCEITVCAMPNPDELVF